jgi:hypothetical protein
MREGKEKFFIFSFKTLLSPSVLNMQTHEHRVKNFFATQVEFLFFFCFLFCFVLFCFLFSPLLVFKKVLSEVDRKMRALILSRLIVIAVESVKIHNFSGAVSIVEALQDPAIVRMKRTWSLIPPVLISEMENVVQLIDKKNEYAVLISEMASTAVPGIPFLGALLPRLEQMEEQLP